MFAPILSHVAYAQAIANGHEAYERRFTGLEGIGKSGMTFLEELIDGALRASDAAVPTAASRRFGAACLTESGKMYAGCNVESKSDPSLNVSALRTTILKAVSDGEIKFQGLVISSQTEEFPVPDGTGRQFLSEYGDFPVFCVNCDLEVKRFTTYQLFPMASTRYKKRKKTSDEDIIREMRDEADAESSIRDWTVADVLKWLDDLGFGDYRTKFSQGKVDGTLLLRMDEGDLERYGVSHALHRRKMLNKIDMLRDEDMDENIDLDELDDFLTVLDDDRIRLIARLKVAFDKFDEDGDGLLHKFEVKECFEHMGRIQEELKASNVEAFISATPGPGKDDKSTKGGVQFTDFVVAYCDFFAGSDPDVRAGDGTGPGAIKMNQRVKYLKKSGHVTLLPKKEGKDDGEEDTDEDDEVEEDEVEILTGTKSPKSNKKKKKEKKKEQEKTVTKEDGFEDLKSVRELAQLKQIFDRFAVEESITPVQCIQALHEFGSTAPRTEVRTYLKTRGFSGLQRNIGFFEFMRAAAAVSLEGSALPAQNRKGRGGKGRMKSALYDRDRGSSPRRRSPRKQSRKRLLRDEDDLDSETDETESEEEDEDEDEDEDGHWAKRHLRSPSKKGRFTKSRSRR